MTSITSVKSSNQKLIKGLTLLLFLVAGAIIGFMTPWEPGLSSTGHGVLAGLVVAVGLWILKPGGIPFSISGCLLMVIYLVIGVEPSNVFSGFTSTALWVLIPALFFGFVLVKTGLGKRVAYLVIKMFKPSFAGLIAAWVLIGIVLSVFTPSIIVRVAIIMPVAVSCIDVCKLEKKSVGSSLILLTAWAMAVLPGTGWLTGSLWGPIIMGMFNAVPQLAGQVNFQSWIQVSLLPLELLTVLLVLGGVFVFRPSKPITVTREEFQAEYKKLGALSKEEQYTAIVLLIVFSLFLTSQIHHIPDPAVALGGLFALTALGIINTGELSSGINWDLILFIGVAMGLGSVFADSGLSEWLSAVLAPTMAPLASSPWLFVFGVSLFLFLWRFIDVAIFIPTMAIIIPILPQVASSFGVNPLIWTTLFVIAGNCFFLSYQNMFALVGETIAGDYSWTPQQISKYGLVYFLAGIVSLAITIPYWIAAGMFNC